MAAPEDDPLVIAREQDRALELFVAGKSYRYIAADLSVGRPTPRSVATAHKRVQDALAETRRLKATEYIDVELALMQDLQDRLVQRLAAGVAPERIAPHLLALSKERRRLLGQDAPSRVRVSADPDVPEVPEVGFARVVEEAQREADADEAAIRDVG